MGEHDLDGAHRRLRAGCVRARDARRRAAVHRADRAGDRGEGDVGRAAGTVDAAPDGAGAHRGGGAHRAAEDPGRPVRDGGGVRHRARGKQGRDHGARAAHARRDGDVAVAARTLARRRPCCSASSRSAAGSARGTARPTESAQPTQLALLLPDLGGASTGLQRQIELTPDGTALLYVGLVEGTTRTKRIALDGSAVTRDRRRRAESRRLLDRARRTHLHGVQPRDGNDLPLSDRRRDREAAPAHRRIRVDEASGRATAATGLNYSNGNVGLTRISATDSVSQPFGLGNSDVYLTQILPGDRTALGVRHPIGTATGPLVLVDLHSGESRTLIDQAVVEARYAAGHLVYVLGDGSLQAAPFDLKALRITAPPVTLATGVTLTGGGQAQFSVADNGTVAFVVEAGRTLVVADRTGAGRAGAARTCAAITIRASPPTASASRSTSPGRRDATSGSSTSPTARSRARRSTATGTTRAGAATAGRSPTRRSATACFGVNRIRPGSTQSGDSLLTSPHLAYTGIWLRDESALVTVGQSLHPESSLDIAIVRNGGRGPDRARRRDAVHRAVSRAVAGRPVARLQLQPVRPRGGVRAPTRRERASRSRCRSAARTNPSGARMERSCTTGAR